MYFWYYLHFLIFTMNIFKQKLEKKILSEICTFGRSAGVWSGSALFAYVPQKWRLAYMG